MSARTRTISRPTLQALADRLDAAERDVLESDQCMSDFDFEDAAGHLQHRAAECPWCKLADARSLYFSLAREAAENLRDNPPDLRNTDLTPIIYQLYQKLLAAQAHMQSPDLDTVRKRCDAEAALEFAEVEYEIYWHAWHERIERQRAERYSRNHGTIVHHAVTDGYMKTRKTVLIDGVRVPVVRQVEAAR